MQVSELRMRSIPHVPACTPLYDVLRIMQNMRCHMVVRLCANADAERTRHCTFHILKVGASAFADRGLTAKSISVLSARGV